MISESYIEYRVLIPGEDLLRFVRGYLLLPLRRLNHPALIDSFTQRIGLDPKLLGYLSPILTDTKQLLSLLDYCFSQDAAAAPSYANREKRLGTASAVFVDRSLDAVFRYPKSLDDIDLFTHPPANKLRGVHAKTLAIVFSMEKHRMDAAKVRPLSILAYYADNRVD
jgi:hypothetical protein